MRWRPYAPSWRSVSRSTREGRLDPKALIHPVRPRRATSLDYIQPLHTGSPIALGRRAMGELLFSSISANQVRALGDRLQVFGIKIVDKIHHNILCATASPML